MEGQPWELCVKVSPGSEQVPGSLLKSAQTSILKRQVEHEGLLVVSSTPWAV